jgi:hypothetical protein
MNDMCIYTNEGSTGTKGPTLYVPISFWFASNNEPSHPTAWLDVEPIYISIALRDLGPGISPLIDAD